MRVGSFCHTPPACRIRSDSGLECACGASPHTSPSRRSLWREASRGGCHFLPSNVPHDFPLHDVAKNYMFVDCPAHFSLHNARRNGMQVVALFAHDTRVLAICTNVGQANVQAGRAATGRAKSPVTWNASGHLVVKR